MTKLKTRVTNNIEELKREELIDRLRAYVPNKHFPKIIRFSDEHLAAILFYFEIGGGAEELGSRHELRKARAGLPVEFALVMTEVPSQEEKPLRIEKWAPLVFSFAVGFTIGAVFVAIMIQQMP